jgi:hypothetical protein
MHKERSLRFDLPNLAAAEKFESSTALGIETMWAAACRF